MSLSKKERAIIVKEAEKERLSSGQTRYLFVWIEALKVAGDSVKKIAKIHFDKISSERK